MVVTERFHRLLCLGLILFSTTNDDRNTAEFLFHTCTVYSVEGCFHEYDFTNETKVDAARL